MKSRQVCDLGSMVVVIHRADRNDQRPGGGTGNDQLCAGDVMEAETTRLLIVAWSQ